MNRATLLLALACLAGCSHTSMEVKSTAARGPGVQGGGVHAHAGASGIAGALLVIGILAAASDDLAEGRPLPDPRDLLQPPVQRPAPLAPERSVSEQDCSRPVDLSAGNLKCR